MTVKLAIKFILLCRSRKVTAKKLLISLSRSSQKKSHETLSKNQGNTSTQLGITWILKRMKSVIKHKSCRSAWRQKKNLYLLRSFFYLSHLDGVNIVRNLATWSGAQKFELSLMFQAARTTTRAAFALEMSAWLMMSRNFASINCRSYFYIQNVLSKRIKGVRKFFCLSGWGSKQQENKRKTWNGCEKKKMC